jgi:hydroxypyruvate reductase/glycerate 2-kinase
MTGTSVYCIFYNSNTKERRIGSPREDFMDQKILLDLFSTALREVDPYRAVARHCRDILEDYGRGSYRGIHVFAFGKAAMGMSRAAVDCLGQRIVKGLVITRRGDTAGYVEDPRIEVHEAGHPLPDQAGVQATMRIMELAQDMDEHDYVLCLISGGASALLVAPYGEISLGDKQTITNALLRAGADIGELNTVRKHISAVKGGRLARMICPGRVRSLILSDVIGDRLDVIGSGPTVPDGTSYADSLDILSRFDLGTEVPGSIRFLLSRGVSGALPETPKPGDPVFEKVKNSVIASNSQAIVAAVLRAEELGLATQVISTDIHGEAREAGTWLAREAGRVRNCARGEGKPVCLISGGETTVTVKGDGMGGRNMELALAFALEVEGRQGITLLSAGTDGSDGPTDAAGAIVDGDTVAKAHSAGLDARGYLMNNDTYAFFDHIGSLVKTGPTGTNVMDLQIAIVTP